MADPFDWDALHAEYMAFWSAVRSRELSGDYEPPAMAVRRMTDPTDDDVRWLTKALMDDGNWPTARKWLVSTLMRDATRLAEVFFQPMLDAAIDEADPSSNRHFVEPCTRSFGARRVNEYLLDVVALGTDISKAGAARALYWASVPLVFSRGAPSLEIEHATSESRAIYEHLQDVWKRKQRLFLETFVANSSVAVRRSIIPALDLNVKNYQGSHRTLVIQAIEIARAHDDHYIRHRVEFQLGEH